MHACFGVSYFLCPVELGLALRKIKSSMAADFKEHYGRFDEFEMQSIVLANSDVTYSVDLRRDFIHYHVFNCWRCHIPTQWCRRGGARGRSPPSYDLMGMQPLNCNFFGIKSI